MAKLDNTEIAALGNRIAKDYLAGKGSINQLVQKLATDHGWNEEQIHRVGRKANVSVFEQKFAAMAREPDRVVSFDIGDSDEVVRNIHGDKAEKTAAAYYPDLPDQVQAIREGDVYRMMDEPISVKTAMFEVVEETRTPEMAEHYRTAHDKLQERCCELENKWVRCLQKVASASRTIGWNHDAFEQNAVASFGSDVLIELNGVREAMDMAPSQMSKTAADYALENFFGHETEETELLKTAMDLRAEILKTRAARDLAKTTYLNLESAVS